MEPEGRLAQSTQANSWTLGISLFNCSLCLLHFAPQQPVEFRTLCLSQKNFLKQVLPAKRLKPRGLEKAAAQGVLPDRSCVKIFALCTTLFTVDNFGLILFKLQKQS